jgi:predicted TIM-barrel fold metal-dependent hydrolase
MMRRRDFLKGGAAAVAASTTAAPKEVNAQSLAGAASYAGSPKTPDRPWTVPQRPTAPISIDVHTHWAPAEYMKLKAQYGQPDNSSPSNYDWELRAKSMDAQGVQMQVLTLGGFMPWQWVTAEQGTTLAKVTNDAAIEAHKAMPDRFVFAIELSAGDASGSLKELNRVAGKPGLVAVHLPNSLANREYLFEPAFAPVLARCNELELPILLHPLDGEPNWFAGHRLADEYSGPTGAGAATRFPGLTNQVGDPYEQGVTAAKLIVNGTLDKYPNLQVVLAQAGGTFPFIVGRIDFRGAGILKLQHPVKDYIRRFYYDSLTFYPPTLQYLITLAGSDRVVLGTDSMGPGPNAGTQQPVRATGPGPHSVIDQLDISAEDRDLILKGNLKRLFKL